MFHPSVVGQSHSVLLHRCTRLAYFSIHFTHDRTEVQGHVDKGADTPIYKFLIVPLQYFYRPGAPVRISDSILVLLSACFDLFSWITLVLSRLGVLVKHIIIIICFVAMLKLRDVLYNYWWKLVCSCRVKLAYFFNNKNLFLPLEYCTNLTINPEK